MEAVDKMMAVDPRDQRRRGCIEFEELIKNCTSVVQYSDAEVAVGTFRIEVDKAGHSKQAWCEVHKCLLNVKDPESGEVKNSSCMLAEIKQGLIWKLLDNRRYFNTCRCCGYLNHVDEMQDRLCQPCLDQPVDTSKWQETEFIDDYIQSQYVSPSWQPAGEPGSFSDIDSLISLDYLEVEPEESKHVYGILFNNWSWTGPHESDSKWKRVKRFDPPLDASDSEIIQSEVLKVLGNRNYFNFCVGCGKLNHKENLANRTCSSCMSDLHGIVY